ncbi:hypothetical protein [Sphingopyxis sp.]|uniref:hypothetical protein n=1 Tax=Sphingopyxis sp. TaxID=1908224 RepID=UPI002D7F757C|nr:hypothetical protein [Sphingopyxis sp.]
MTAGLDRHRVGTALIAGLRGRRHRHHGDCGKQNAGQQADGAASRGGAMQLVPKESRIDLRTRHSRPFFNARASGKGRAQMGGPDPLEILLFR